MPVDPELLRALRTSVEATPDNVTLRLHLAGILVEAGEAAEALEHCTTVLTSQPADREALRVAALAAEAAEERERANGYRALLMALDAPARPKPEGTADIGDLRVPAEGAPEEDEYDTFLREVIDNADLDVERPAVTLADVGGLGAMPRASFFWTRSTPWVSSGRTSATRRGATSSFSYSPSWTARAATTGACSSWAPPTSRGTSTPPCAGPADSTECCSCSRRTPAPAAPSSPTTYVGDRPMGSTSTGWRGAQRAIRERT